MKHIKTQPKRVCAIHDLSAFGRCALTVVIPTLSALGIQTIPLPTALMSTHTGGYEDIYIRDLSKDMNGIKSHWLSLGVSFDAIYTGFVLDASQGEIITEFIDDFSKTDPMLLVDPVMGDNGMLYSTCTEELREVMLHLCERADVITPNLTEACILTGIPYPEATFTSEEKARQFSAVLLDRLSHICKKIAITGIEFSHAENIYVMTATCSDGKHEFYPQAKIGASYPGTGELFASVLLGLMLDGESFFYSAKYAGEFVSYTIKASEGAIEETRHGTALEPSLMKLSHDTYEKMKKQASPAPSSRLSYP